MSAIDFFTTMGNWFWVFEAIVIISSGVIGIVSQNKIDLIRKLKRVIIRWFNVKSKVKIYLEYKTKSSLNEVVTQLLSTQKEKNKNKKFKQTSIKEIILFDTYTFTCIKNQEKNIIFETNFSCGIRSLRDELRTILAKFNSLLRRKILDSFLVCEIELTLPFNWDYFVIHKPKKYFIEKYKLVLKESNWNSLINFQGKKIILKFSSEQAISPTIEDFL